MQGACTTSSNMQVEQDARGARWHTLCTSCTMDAKDARHAAACSSWSDAKTDSLSVPCPVSEVAWALACRRLPGNCAVGWL